MSTEEEKKARTIVQKLRTVLWYLGSAATLFYAHKYYRRILSWQQYDPSKKDVNYRAHSRQFTSRDLGQKTSIRAKQQKEWDRLILPLSVITATSAAALAIPSPFGTRDGTPDNIYWLATALFSGAFGLSLEGLIIITYLTVFGAGASPETIGRIACGRHFLKGMAGPVAIVTALPTAITTYSSLFLLAGLLSMTIAAGEGGSIQQHMVAFKAIVLGPVCVMLLCLIATVAGCEYFAFKEGLVRSDIEADANALSSDVPTRSRDCSRGSVTGSALTAEPERKVTFQKDDES